MNTHEIKVLWPQHFDLVEHYVRDVMDPVCDAHRETRRRIHDDVDGSIWIERRL